MVNLERSSLGDEAMTRSINWIVAASALALALATVAAPAQARVEACTTR
jgi:hypothetical protein